MYIRTEKRQSYPRAAESSYPRVIFKTINVVAIAPSTASVGKPKIYPHPSAIPRSQIDNNDFPKM
eukprot:274944-Amphidinium_carterae.1